MRLAILGIVASVFLVGTLLNAKPIPPDKKEDPTPAFKPLSFMNDLAENDPKDEKLNYPSKKFTVKLQKDKTYVIDMASKEFDTYLRLLDKKGKQLAEDDDGGGELNSRIIASASESGDHTIIATSFDGQDGHPLRGGTGYARHLFYASVRIHACAPTIPASHNRRTSHATPSQSS